MTFEEAKTLLSTCQRDSLVDRAFGDAEVYWMLGTKVVAEGYFGREHDGVTIIADGSRFEGKEAKKLRHLGTKGQREFNDAGPQK